MDSRVSSSFSDSRLIGPPSGFSLRMLPAVDIHNVQVSCHACPCAVQPSRGIFCRLCVNCRSTSPIPWLWHQEDQQKLCAALHLWTRRTAAASATGAASPSSPGPARPRTAGCPLSWRHGPASRKTNSSIFGRRGEQSRLKGLQRPRQPARTVEGLLSICACQFLACSRMRMPGKDNSGIHAGSLASKCVPAAACAWGPGPASRARVWCPAACRKRLESTKKIPDTPLQSAPAAACVWGRPRALPAARGYAPRGVHMIPNM